MTFKPMPFICSGIYLALASVGHAQNPVAIDTNKAGPTLNVDEANAAPRSFDPVPEPSTGSVILLGLGGVGLALYLRKRA